MTTQVQIRGAAAGTQNARTLVSRELDVDTTSKRLSVHDGSTSGGIKHATFADIQTSEYDYAVATGTNALTVTLAPAPAAHTNLGFKFKAAATNTGAMTINPNSLGAKNILKKDTVSGTLVAMAAGDVISGGVYELFYDGTQYQIWGSIGGGLTSISQGDLNTSSGTVSMTIPSLPNPGGNTATRCSPVVVLPGGQYGFDFLTRNNVRTSDTRYSFVTHCQTGGSYVASVMGIVIGDNAINSHTPSAQQRYVNSSPPYDLGNGIVSGFVFLLVNKNTAEIEATYAADAPPWVYNGPTNVKAVARDAQGRKYRQPGRSEIDIEQAVKTGRKDEVSLELITNELKNADMSLIPHPFSAFDSTKYEVVLVDPMCAEIERLIRYQNEGDDILPFVKRMRPDTDWLDKRCGPEGVKQAKFSINKK